MHARPSGDQAERRRRRRMLLRSAELANDGMKARRIAAALSLAILLTAGGAGFIGPAMGEPAAAAGNPSGALAAYQDALPRFKAVLAERRAEIDAHKPLPNLPGQALYLARNGLIGSYKDLTDAEPSRIGRPNKWGIPPAYFDAANEPLLEEYYKLFGIMDAPPANAQSSATPLKDVVDLAAAIARAKGLDAGT